MHAFKNYKTFLWRHKSFTYKQQISNLNNLDPKIDYYERLYFNEK
ncbi:hypothetical protein VCHA36P161_80188 [Vibrio chagasii]|nr:hypothetical protein VCHA37O173_80187 [Vibrio chagasii]CAH7095075.1 hypothetical protein VCHA36P161_80188 [Vibrio chagasii]CAH7120121.1 hypothetical protein VCHA29O39_90190 [Vibrio chagasii]CAH7153733.1 hypothetical protein VCHA37P199_220008 [Vibrio chagasii]